MCGFTQPLVGSGLLHIESFGFLYGQERVIDLDTMCAYCGEGRLSLRLNELDDRDVCGLCHKVDRQETIRPCSAIACVGGGDGMHHSSCMVRTGIDLFTCRACLLAGVALENDDSDVSSSNASDSDANDSEMNNKYRMVQAYGDLQIGMPLGAGIVQEIWPGIDRFMVHIQRHGGVEIQHFSIAEDAKRLIAKEAARVAAAKCGSEAKGGLLESMD